MEPKQVASSAPAGAASVVTAPEKRREKRLHLAVPVKVFPDVASIESHNCCTYEISTNGARLVAPPGIKKVGQTIWLQRQNRRARHSQHTAEVHGCNLLGETTETNPTARG